MALAGAAVPVTVAAPQATTVPVPPAKAPFTFQEVMVPMRDGAKLQTVILRPTGKTGPLPILLQRTPYGVPQSAPSQVPDSYKALMKDGYIFVYQSMRGRFKSDGSFTFSTAVHPDDPKAVDEATDAYDTIDWLVKNVADNNGKVGMWGVSYPGFAAAVALADPHPALKAVSPQAAWVDYWMNDDLHRYGAMRLSYATDWLYMLQHDKAQDSTFEYDQYDTYDWFLRQTPVAKIDQDYFKGSIPMFTAMLDHSNDDAFWKKQDWLGALKKTTVPTLNVAGFWDQEDPWGSWQIYYKQEQNDPDHLNQIVAGPWNHGGWHGRGDTMGRIPIGTDSGIQFQQQIEAPFFAYWLHGKGKRPDFEARMFESGSFVWKSYKHWPPRGAVEKSLYLHVDGTVSFDRPDAGEACRSYISDPDNPVPFRPRPISPTYPIPDWRLWEFGDQRFVGGRPDVLSYKSAPLEHDLTVTGELAATLMASTSGTDSDFVVKLIDVYPDNYEQLREKPELGDYGRSLNGYQLPVAMEVRRGRFLESAEVPHALTPNKVIAWNVPLRSHDHVFKKGHRIMVQVQSSWFPVIDRNPQKFVPNIYRARPEDFVTARQRVCAGSKITLPVMAE
ncbi:CocE/NonD family hydrolase [Stakelama sediminis]